MTNALQDAISAMRDRPAGELIHPFLTDEGCMALARIMVGDSDEGRKKLDNFRDALRKHNELFDNLFSPQKVRLPEEYLKGRFIIVLDGRLSSAKHDRNRRFFISIESHGASGKFGLSIDKNEQIA